MDVDAELLQRARQAAGQLREAEQKAELAKAEYHTAVRRLHLAGRSLREIASALELSHQRVQQIVDRAGGTWWGRIWRSRRARRDAVCTFCHRPPSEVAKLIAGPNVYICDACVARSEAVVARKARGARSKARCSFCGKRSVDARPVASGTSGAVCVECLGACRQILDGREHRA